jgi:hypothetical protein
MGQTFIERYNQEETWYGRAMVMEILHLTMTSHNRDWSVSKTAVFFGVSVGLASENLKLAAAIHVKEDLMKCPTRQEALRKIR